jgi:NAD(P)-dependent dehydrogenase (short-subunit alcohol dehydrogenase family)
VTPVTVLITGANRGIGLEHARHFAARRFQVLACCRQPAEATELETVRRRFPDQVQVLALDVTDEVDVMRLAATLANTPIDILINNAGTYGPEGAPDGMAYQGLGTMDYGIWRQILEVNLLAPFRLTAALAASLRAGQRKLVVMMSSDLGSIANNTQGHSHAYRTSKAGLNMLTRGIAAEWQDLIIVSMAPGWCRTDLGGEAAVLDPADSVRDQQATFDRLTMDHSGTFIDRFGANVPW